jgi:hypothetical protein
MSVQSPLLMRGLWGLFTIGKVFAAVFAVNRGAIRRMFGAHYGRGVTIMHTPDQAVPGLVVERLERLRPGSEIDAHL